jgi:tRNA A-37 threonylcarbamoyl transferase component Bud32/SAM-dependent methyltransferase
MSIYKKIGLSPVIVRQVGMRQLVRVGYIYFFEPQIMKVMPVYAGLIKKTRTMWKILNKKRDLAYWSSRKSEIISRSTNVLDIAELGLNEYGQTLLEEQLKATNQVVIAKIDQDGFFLSLFGQIEGIPCVDEAHFIPRVRSCLDLITVDRKVGVKKDYKGRVVSFIREIEALHALRKAGCNVPSILDVDFENCSLTISFIPGTVLREQLASRGATLRDRDVDDNPQFIRLSPEARSLKKITEGKKYLGEIVSQDFIEKLFDQVVKIHSAGFIIRDIKYGNVIVEKKTGNPYLIDFESSNNVTGTGHSVFRQLRDYDIEKFNMHFGTDKPTFLGLRGKMANQDFLSPEMCYSPWYIGSGLRVGALWDPKSGWGRWHYILKDNLPNLMGKRVLDLGANNGFNSLQMLRSGAREGIGFEIDPNYIQQGQFLKSAMEWSDNRKYDFRYIQSSMVELKSMDLGHFDLVMALCSLYYLDDDEISGLIRHVSTITDCFIVQCNSKHDIGRDFSHTYEKASVEFMKRALEENGFPDVRLIAPRHYSRPLLIGGKSKVNVS